MSRQSRREGAPGDDSFVEQLGDRLSADGGRKVLPLRRPDGSRLRPPSGEQAQVPPSEAFPPPPRSGAPPPPASAPPPPPDPHGFDVDEPTTTDGGPPPYEHRSDVHEVPQGDDGVPYVEHPDDADDPFAQFEDDLEGESTRIDTQHLIAEQTTNILEESPDPPYLEVESGKDLGKQFVLNPGETTVGRSIDNDVILTDIAVSRRHLKITLHDDGSLRLHDLGSGNGSQLNGRRVYDSPLTDGDRIELGETVLLVRVPSEFAVLEEGPDQVERSTTEEEALRSLPPPPTAGIPNRPGPIDPTTFVPDGGARAVSTDYITSPPSYAQGQGVVVPRGWLLAGVLVAGLLVALLGATITALLLRSGSDAPEVTVAADADPDEILSIGTEAYESGRWEEAQRAYEQVLAAEPGHEEAQQGLRRVAEAREHQGALEEARTALQEGDAETALGRAASIPEESPLHAQAEALRRAAQAHQLSEIVRVGMAALEAGDLEMARGKLEEARTHDPDAEGVRELAAAIEEAGEDDGEEPRVARADTPRRQGRAEAPARRREARRTQERAPRARRERASAGERGESRALAMYRQGNFSAAAQAARHAADSASDSERRDLLRLAQRIEQFSAAYQRAEAARFSAAVVRQMQSAVSLDNQISGGHYARRIKPHLVDAYLTQARQTRDPSRSCQAVRQALAIDSSSGAAQRMARNCEANASRLVREARGLERSNRARAIQLYRQVLTMVPRGSDNYTQAYQRLNNLARRSGVDEDE